MAATDTFLSFVSALSNSDRLQLAEYIEEQRAELLAARSEEARVRIAHESMRRMHDRLRASRKA